MDKVYELIPLLPQEICSKLRLYLETPTAKITREEKKVYNIQDVFFSLRILRGPGRLLFGVKNESESEPQINRCLECGVDMGDCNPRQYCGKWRCNDAEY